jgi:hypothetical protein
MENQTSAQASNSSEGICVGIRMRPLNEKELNSGQEMIFKCQTSYNAISQLKDGQPLEGQTFYYDKVFDENSRTSDVYTHIGRDIVAGVMGGINGTIFACTIFFKQIIDNREFNLYFHRIIRWANQLWKNSHDVGRTRSARRTGNGG